jgi:hypothetical protein
MATLHEKQDGKLLSQTAFKLCQTSQFPKPHKVYAPLSPLKSCGGGGVRGLRPVNPPCFLSWSYVDTRLRERRLQWLLGLAVKESVQKHPDAAFAAVDWP